MQTTILAIGEENINEQSMNSKALVQVLDNDSALSSF